MLTFIYIILVHWVADFVFQTRQMGDNKNSSSFWMLMHVFCYSGITLIGWSLLSIFTGLDISLINLLISFLLVFATHYITDYFSSKITHKFANEKKWYGFFTTIGFDQVLHYTQLFLIYNYIILNN